MGIKAVHPSYLAMHPTWEEGNDCYDGEDAIKSKGTTYLPPTSGQVADGQGTDGTEGEKSYQAYKTRAIYHDFYKEAVEACIGIMHRKPPTFELPTALEPLLTRSTLLGESLEMVLRRINARQLITGRVGVLGDIEVGDEGPVPTLALYNELAVRNWDDTSAQYDDLNLRMAVLDESKYEMDQDFEWTLKAQYRVLSLLDEEAMPSDAGVYGGVLLEESEELLAKPFQIPELRGTKLDRIPFAFINSKDISPTPDRPPLFGLAKLALAIYRGEADYRQNLFMQGQDTLVRIGVVGDDDSPVRTGAGARIDVPQGGDAKYIGISSNGLPEQRQALESDKRAAAQKAGHFLEASGGGAESGDALRIRMAAQTATLPQIAKAGAAGLEKVLKDLARWYGANPDEVVVKPNLEFTQADLQGRTLVEIMQAKGLDAPLSEASIHRWLQEQGFTSLSYEDELAAIDQEGPKL